MEEKAETVKEATGMAELTVKMDTEEAKRINEVLCGAGIVTSDLLDSKRSCPFCSARLGAEVTLFRDGSSRTVFRCDCGFRFEKGVVGMEVPPAAYAALDAAVEAMYGRVSATAKALDMQDKAPPEKEVVEKQDEEPKEQFWQSGEQFADDGNFCLVHRDFDPGASINHIPEKYIKMICDDYHKRGASRRKLAAKYEMPECKIKRILHQFTVMRPVKSYKRNKSPTLVADIMELFGKGLTRQAIANQLKCSWAKVDSVIRKETEK